MTFFSSHVWPPYVVPLIVFISVTLVLLAFRALILKSLLHAAKGHPKGLFISVANVFRSPSLLWIVAIALHVGVGRLGLPEEATRSIRILLQLIVIGSVCLASSAALEMVLRHGLSRANSGLVGSGLVRGLVWSFVFGLGALVACSQLGIHVGPMLTALGVGGLAVGLALQDTLGNLFAGISLVLDRSITVGDRLKLSTGHEGKLVDVGWRTSKILLDTADTLILPNTKLAQDLTVRRKSGETAPQ